jgi:hypothetical protein
VAIDVDSAEVEPLDFHPHGLAKLAAGSS